MSSTGPAVVTVIVVRLKSLILHLKGLSRRRVKSPLELTIFLAWGSCSGDTHGRCFAQIVVAFLRGVLARPWFSILFKASLNETLIAAETTLTHTDLQLLLRLVLNRVQIVAA